MHGIEVKAIIVNDTTAVDPFLLKTNVADMERYTGIPVVAVVPPYQGQIFKRFNLVGPAHLLILKNYGIQF